MKLDLKISDENSVLFKRCIRKLLNGTFILGEKEERLYSFLEKPSNRQDVSDYLQMMGFDILVDTDVRLAMLIQNAQDEESIGLKSLNCVRFTADQYHMLLVLWEAYLENLGFHQENCIPKGQLIDKLKAYGVELQKRDFNAALQLFKKYNLINYNDKENTEDALITLYPSLQFGWNLEQFKRVSEEYINGAGDKTSEEGDTI